VEIPGEFGGAYFGEYAEGEGDDVIVVAVEVDADAVGGHHEEFGLLVEELCESCVVGAVPR
jgi:hypothetical protein